MPPSEGLRRFSGRRKQPSHSWMTPVSTLLKNIPLAAFNLGGNLDRVPDALKELFKFAIDGSVKVEITKYPLADASIAHSVFEARKSTGKLVLVR